MLLGLCTWRLACCYARAAASGVGPIVFVWCRHLTRDEDRTSAQRCASLETYTHAVLECPVARPAVQWLTALVAAFDGMAPVITVESLVVGDHTVWMPVSGEEAFGLWQHVKLAFVFAAWELRCCCTSRHRPFSAAEWCTPHCCWPLTWG